MTQVSKLKAHNSLLTAVIGMELSGMTSVANIFSDYERKERRPTNIHPMITTSNEEIRAWNEAVERKKREKKKYKILAKLKSRGIAYE